jgi:quinol monooxygenase YgiN
MSDYVSWMLELTIKPGELDNLKALMKEMVESTEAGEPDTRNYEWFFDADETTCHLWERYADSAAAMVHLGHFGEKYADRFMAALEPTRFVVYGNPSDEVKEALSPFGAIYMVPVSGFAR